MMMDYSIHKVIFLNSVNFHVRVLGNVQNTAGVNHSRFYAIAEILLRRSPLPEIKILKIRDGYIIAAISPISFILSRVIAVLKIINGPVYITLDSCSSFCLYVICELQFYHLPFIVTLEILFRSMEQ